MLDFIKKAFAPSAKKQTFESNDSIIVDFPEQPGLKKLVLVGHLDAVPKFFPPHFEEKSNLVYGSGASDMKASLAVFLAFSKNREFLDLALKNYNLAFIFYAREEGTPIEQNGLNDLIRKFPKFFKGLDLAIVGEPTNNQIQLGSLGSLHARVKILGKSCHSARPWQGENALYKAVKLIREVEKIKPRKKKIMGLDFFDVVEITESETEKGTTTIPGYWVGNVNYRFTPEKSLPQARKYLKKFINDLKITNLHADIYSESYSGMVSDTPFLWDFIKAMKTKVCAKQAWTDVAQFAKLKIPALNFGPGLSEQCHKENEFADFSLVLEYSEKLFSFLMKENKEN